MWIVLEKRLSLQDRIVRKDRLSRTEKKIADFMLADQASLGVTTVTSLAAKIGTSDTSIIRFLRSLGYEGFSDFRQEMSQGLLESVNTARDNMTPGEKYLRTNDLLDGRNVLSEVMGKATGNLESVWRTMDPEIIEKAAGCIAASRRKYIVGFRGASSCAVFASRKLSLLVPGVICVERAESIAVERCIDITAGDCMLMFSFPRYSMINYTLLRLARENGAKVILVTDRYTSPLAPHADLVLAGPVEGGGVTVSYVVPMVLAEAVILLVSRGLDPQQKARMKRLDELISTEKLF